MTAWKKDEIALRWQRLEGGERVGDVLELTKRQRLEGGERVGDVLELTKTYIVSNTIHKP